MPNRADDWLNQAQRNLEQAQASKRDGRHEWACFAAQQAAELSVEALHLFLGQEAWGLVYTLDEWESLSASASKFAEVISREAVWLKSPDDEVG